MNGVKSTVIFVLSVIVLLQSAFLVYFMHRSRKVSGGVARVQEASSQKSAAKRPLFKPEFFKPSFSKGPVAPAPKPQPASGAVAPVAVVEKPKPKALPSKTLGRIVLILDDWGYNLKHKGFITDNDFHVTLSVLPGKPYSRAVAMMASEKNKDVIIHMPMEPHDKNQYGLEENTLMVGMAKSKIFAFLLDAFGSVPHAIGLSNHMGSRATEDARLMKFVMEFLKKNEMVFFDSLSSGGSLGRETARQYGVRSASRDVFIDNKDDPDYIRQQMIKLAEHARQAGVAFGVGHDRSRTIAVLSEMIPRLEEEGYQFMKLSEVVGS
jgi:polysaccharide deacetylase 2 family uncharacterized protein YibQ